MSEVDYLGIIGQLVIWGLGILGLYHGLTGVYSKKRVEVKNDGEKKTN